MTIAPLVYSSLPDAGDEIWEPHIADLLERHNLMAFEYSKSLEVFVSNFRETLRQGGVPGATDAFADEPEAKVSRLVQRIVGILEGHIPGFGTRAELVSEGAEAFGADPRAMRIIVLCAAIHNTVYKEMAEASLLERLKKIDPVIR